MRFERGTRTVAGLQTRRACHRRVYDLEVPVPHYSAVRRVEIHFRTSDPTAPHVFVDGPAASPHRYSDGTLCMWNPWDPYERRWVFVDGLAALIAAIETHLFREAWWRETAEWLGPEAPHAPTTATGIVSRG